MRKPNLLLSQCLLAGLLAAQVAAPASAGVLWEWTTEDGSAAFTDDADRIPARYREQAKRREVGGLGSFGRYTPRDRSADEREARGLAERVERLRELNAPPLRRVAEGGPAGAAASAGGEAVIQINDEMSVRVPTGGGGEGPVVVEQVRVKADGSIFTHHNTVVRRGDEILMIVRPDQPHQAGPNDFIDESELLE
jgi:hypothetical protein